MNRGFGEIRIAHHLNGGIMPVIHIVLIAAFFGLAIIWPMSFFGYKFYKDHTHVEDSGKH